MASKGINASLILNIMIASAVIWGFVVSPQLIKPVTAAPYLQLVTEYNYSPLLDNCPYGRLNIIVPISKQLQDGVPSHDWYFYEIRQQTVPGTVSCGTDWKTAHAYATHTVYSPGTNRWLVDYDPTTTTGSTTVTVTSSANGFSTSWTYSVADVKVIDLSDFSQHRAQWEHDINEQVGAAAASGTYLARPGLVVKTVQNAWSYIDATYSVMWGRLGWWWEYQTYNSGTLFLDANLGGDGGTAVRIVSYRTTDIYDRSHGMSVDTALPNPWWPPYQSGYQFMTSAGPVDYTTTLSLGPGSHYVKYGASGYLPSYAWHGKIYINGVLKAEGDVDRSTHITASFTV